MRVRVLGSAAGGGFPQWNCLCHNCARFRKGTIRATARTQSQVTISADGINWHLLNASPDLRTQIESFEPLRPKASLGILNPFRTTAIQSITLTNADLDHSLGLLLLRESQSLQVYSTRSVKKLILEQNCYFGMLEQRPGQLNWCEIRTQEPFEMIGVNNQPNGLICHPLFLPGAFPKYSSLRKIEGLNTTDAVLGLSVVSQHTGGRLLYLPGVAEITDPLLSEINKSDVVLFDGTFWSNTELSQFHLESRSAIEMGHTPISGANGSLIRLASLLTTRKVYIHINNTNPILDEESFEYRTVRDSGFEVAYDGWETFL